MIGGLIDKAVEARLEQMNADSKKWQASRAQADRSWQADIIASINEQVTAINKSVNASLQDIAKRASQKEESAVADQLKRIADILEGFRK